MKTTLYPIVLMAYAVAASQGGEFVNLTFDEPDLSRARYRDYPVGLAAPMEDAVRGWTIQWDWRGEPLPEPELVGVESGGAPLGLLKYGFGPWGAYSLHVNGHWSPSQDDLGPLRPTLHLSQTGTIPTDAWLLRLEFNGGPFSPRITYIDGEVQYEAGMEGIPAYSCIDVSKFAGQEVKLEVVFPEGEYYSFDIFGFVAIPEPSVLALLAGGGFGLWLARRRGLGAGRGG